MSQQLKVHGPNLRDRHYVFHVHSAHCRDNRNYGPGARLGGERDELAHSYESRADVVLDVYQDQIRENGGDAEGYDQDFRFFPCVVLS